ncbi:MAG: hypothetical protein ABIC95_04495 [archaeon]
MGESKNDGHSKTKHIFFSTLCGDFILSGSRVRPVKKGADAKDAVPLREEDICTALSAVDERLSFPELRKRNLALTKQQIKESFSPDQLIIHAINAVEDLERVSNTMLGRLGERLGLVAPEASERLRGSIRLAELAAVPDLPKALKAAGLTTTMGAKVEKADSAAIRTFADAAVRVEKEHGAQEAYLEAIMNRICPNLTVLAGAALGAKLIRHAGSLKHLGELPSSTLQVLGAEKALFRHIVTGARPPKYGVISQHPIILQAKRAHHGKLARLLADKIMIAVRVDYFGGAPIAEKLKEELDKRVAHITAH